MSDFLAAQTDPQLDAEMSVARNRYAARRAAELVSEDPSMSAQKLVDLLLSEADAAQATVEMRPTLPTTRRSTLY